MDENTKYPVIKKIVSVILQAVGLTGVMIFPLSFMPADLSSPIAIYILVCWSLFFAGKEVIK